MSEELEAFMIVTAEASGDDYKFSKIAPKKTREVAAELKAQRERIEALEIEEDGNKAALRAIQEFYGELYDDWQSAEADRDKALSRWQILVNTVADAWNRGLVPGDDDEAFEWAKREIHNHADTPAVSKALAENQRLRKALQKIDGWLEHAVALGTHGKLIRKEVHKAKAALGEQDGNC